MEMKTQAVTNVSLPQMWYGFLNGEK